MGCFFFKQYDDKNNIEIIDVESNNQLMQNLKFYENQRVDLYDLAYSGKECIL